MPFIYYNPNPKAKRVGDCSVRAVGKALNEDWQSAFLELAVVAMREYDMPSANYVWGKVLVSHGFTVHSIPVLCPDCSTVIDFCEDHPSGTFVLVCDGEHVVTVVDGDYYDTWDSYGDTEFFQSVSGADAERVFYLLNELMDTVKVLQPRLYEATINELKVL